MRNSEEFFMIYHICLVVFVIRRFYKISKMEEFSILRKERPGFAFDPMALLVGLVIGGPDPISKAQRKFSFAIVGLCFTFFALLYLLPTAVIYILEAVGIEIF